MTLRLAALQLVATAALSVVAQTLMAPLPYPFADVAASS